MTIAILCGYLNSRYARDILKALNHRGLQGVHVVAAGGPAARRSVHQLWKTHGIALPLVAARWILGRLASACRALFSHTDTPAPTLASETTAQGGRFVIVHDVNSEDTRRVLRELGVDLMILGGAPIVKAPILQVPRVGTLNAHQGPLPQLRGMNVIEWALLEGIPPTITVHFVDPGVDTGDIIAMARIPIRPGDTLDSVRATATRVQSEVLAQTACEADKGLLPRQSQRKEDGKQYYAMHPRLKAVAEVRLPLFAQGTG
jgi:methionyl-tRNA formyltransferase